MRTGKGHVVSLLDELGIRPSKKLGQNFLVDPNLIEKMVSLGNTGPDTPVLEIGAGLGDLSCALLNTGCHVTAVELDRRLCVYLREIFEGQPRFELIEGDACKLDYDQIMGEQQVYRTISSLPYSAGSPIIARFLELVNPPRDMVVLLQREVGQRLAALPGHNKAYGSLSVRVQQAYEVRIEAFTPPDVFYPPPQVSSALVRMKAKKPFPSPSARLRLANLCAAAFQHRRKKLFKGLAREYGEATTKALFSEVGLDEDIRPDAVTPDSFESLSEYLQQLNQSDTM